MGFRGKLRGWHITFGDAGENPGSNLKTGGNLYEGEPSMVVILSW